MLTRNPGNYHLWARLGALFDLYPKLDLAEINRCKEAIWKAKNHNTQ
jgi:hypothetical protein